MIECQARYIIGAIRTLIDRDLDYLDIRPSELDADDARTQRILATTVWAAPDRSWYKTESGRITNNWCGSTVRYWWVTRRFDAEPYHARVRAARPATAARRLPDQAPSAQTTSSAA
jgi:hypothetical protein